MGTAKVFTGQRITLLVIFAFLACVLGVFVGKHWQKPLAQQVQATLLPQPKTLSSFTLTGANKKSFTNQDLQNHWTLLFFGFTNCGYVCPTTMAVLKQVYSNLQADKQTLPQVIFVSIDPERDTLSRIQKYVTSFNPNFQGVTGSKQQLDKLTKELNVLYMKVKSTGGDQKKSRDYQIDHSGTVLLMDPEGQLFAVFSMPHDADSITKDFETITSRFKYA
jgi:protein SCO1/2